MTTTISRPPYPNLLSHALSHLVPDCSPPLSLLLLGAVAPHRGRVDTRDSRYRENVFARSSERWRCDVDDDGSWRSSMSGARRREKNLANEE